METISKREKRNVKLSTKNVIDVERLDTTEKSAEQNSIKLLQSKVMVQIRKLKSEHSTTLMKKKQRMIQMK